MDAIKIPETVNPSSSIAERITLRPVEMPDDEPFLRMLYFSTRDDLDLFFPDENAKAQILTLQFAGQSMTYAKQYPEADHDVIMIDGESVGRMMVDRRADAVHLIDIALLPTVRNAGIGSSLLDRLKAQARSHSLPVELSVVKTNPAVRLYEREGFVVIADNDPYVFMRWTPESNLDSYDGSL